MGVRRVARALGAAAVVAALLSGLPTAQAAQPEETAAEVVADGVDDRGVVDERGLVLLEAPRIAERAGIAADRLGSIHLDDDRRVLRIAVKDLSSAEAARLAGPVSVRGAGPYSEASVEPYAVAYSQTEIEDLQQAIREDEQTVAAIEAAVGTASPDGLPNWGFATDLRTSRTTLIVRTGDDVVSTVERLVAPATLAEIAPAELRKALLNDRTAPPFDVRADTYGRVSESRHVLPPRPAKWIRVDDGGKCTLGFLWRVNSTGTHYGTTAAHCENDTSGFGPVRMFSPTTGSQTGYVGSIAGTAPGVDVMWFTLPTATHQQRVFTGPQGYRRITGSVVETALVGGASCHGGIWTNFNTSDDSSASDTKCGPVNWTVTLGFWTYFCSSADTGDGDSGGAVWRNNDPGTAYALGIVILGWMSFPTEGSESPGADGSDRTCFASQEDVRSTLPSNFSFFYDIG